MCELPKLEYISLQVALMAHLSKTEKTSRGIYQGICPQVCNGNLALGLQMLVIAF